MTACEEICLKSFLRYHGFKNLAQMRSSWFRREKVCPIHVAAREGDFEVLRFGI